MTEEKQPVNEPAKNKDYNALVLDEVKGKCLEQLDRDKIPPGSITRKYRGYDVHLLKRDKDSNITLLEINTKVTKGYTPSDVFDALQCPDAAELFCTPEPKWKASAPKLLVIVSCCLLFFLFMVWAVNLGG